MSEAKELAEKTLCHMGKADFQTVLNDAHACARVILSQEKEIERLRAALKPFADYAEQNSDWIPERDDEELSHAQLDRMPIAGWFLRAKQAMEGK